MRRITFSYNIKDKIMRKHPRLLQETELILRRAFLGKVMDSRFLPEEDLAPLSDKEGFDPHRCVD